MICIHYSGTILFVFTKKLRKLQKDCGDQVAYRDPESDSGEINLDSEPAPKSSRSDRMRNIAFETHFDFRLLLEMKIR
jgi:hypothetical protein